MHSKANVCILDENIEDNFLNWLVQSLGPVLMGCKPAELISLPTNDKNLTSKKQRIENLVCRCRKIHYKIFTYNASSVKLLFYNPIALDNYLKDQKNHRFLVSQGYPIDYSMNTYLDLLVAKMKQGEIPHEIGIFLGYPVKDVMGFMGHSSLKLTKINGWRVYGNPRISDQRFEEFSKVKRRIQDLLEIYKPEKILYTL